MNMVRVPKPSELSEYYQTYLKYFSDGDDMLKLLEEQKSITQNFLSSISPEKENFAYADGKWMLKEIIGHLTDTERILSYRALCFSRGEEAALPGFDENIYAQHSNYKTRSLKSISVEFFIVRQSSILLFSNMSEKMFDMKGIANNSEVSVRAVLFMLIGHERHHLRVIKEKYLS